MADPESEGDESAVGAVVTSQVFHFPEEHVVAVFSAIELFDHIPQRRLLRLGDRGRILLDMFNDSSRLFCKSVLNFELPPLLKNRFLKLDFIE